LLGPGGEFTFVILLAATASRLIDPDAGAFALALAAATMAIIPFLEKATAPLERRAPETPPDVLPPDLVTEEARVLVCGFGRVGRTVADMLGRHDVPYLAIDSSPALVARERRKGTPIAYGDSVQIDLLRRCGFAEARALVITLDRASDVTEIVRAARLERPDLPIIARARDERHAAELYRLGATDAVPEALEASLVLCEQMLVDLGVPMGYVIASVHDKRAEQRAEIQALAPGADIRRSRLLRPKEG
jgi:CPA2 family monovalent cation:H+ antiporter-2